MTDEPGKNLDAGAPGALPPPPPGPAFMGHPKTDTNPKGAGRKPGKRLGLSKPPAGGGPGQPAGLGVQPAGNIAPALWTPTNCKAIGKLPFLGAGIATGWAGWDLNDAEAESIAAPLAEVLNAWIPQGGPYAAAAALGSTLFVVGAMKYKGYREHLADEAAKAKEKGAESAGAGK